jgi:glucokinase
MLVAVEIGGTKLQLGLAAAAGPMAGGGIRGSAPISWADFHRGEVDPALGAKGILEQIRTVVADWNRTGPAIQAMGIGFGGPVNNGRIITSHQISGWNDFALADWVRETLRIPRISVANDCDTAAIAEATGGAGRAVGQEATVFYVTVGTGVGGGLVVGGKLHGAGQPSAAEIGHLRPGTNAETPSDTVESLASGWGITNTARNWLLAGRADTQADTQDGRQILDRAGSLEALDTRLLAELAASGNGLALASIQQGVTTLGWAIAQVIAIAAPHVIVVGGGVSLMGDDLFFNPLREAVQRYVFPPLKDSFQVVPAELGEAVVLHGALALAAQAASSAADAR